MPLLLTESLDPARREHVHQHIEGCELCSSEWNDYRETWTLLTELPEVEVPAQLKSRFLSAAGIAAEPKENVIPFRRRPAFKWIAQAAAVVLLAGGGYFAGRGVESRVDTASTPATISSVTPLERSAIHPVSIAETRVLDAAALSPEIQGRPDITNVQFVDTDAADDQIGVSFDVTSRWTVNGSPRDRSMIRLLSYMLESEGTRASRSKAMDWVKQQYADPQYADPEIASAVAKVLRNDAHEGVRIRAIETLTTLPPSVSTDTRDALIAALRSDPNPAVRIKAVEALANLARSGGQMDIATLDTLREKASQGDENLYVRVKAAEALSSIRQ